MFHGNHAREERGTDVFANSLSSGHSRERGLQTLALNATGDLRGGLRRARKQKPLKNFQKVTALGYQACEKAREEMAPVKTCHKHDVLCS